MLCKSCRHLTEILAATTLERMRVRRPLTRYPAALAFAVFRGNTSSLKAAKSLAFRGLSDYHGRACIINLSLREIGL